MKKSFLVLAAALCLGLAACNKPAPAPAGPELPTAEGKVTFWFEMGDNEAAVAVPEYCNIFLTGAFCGWKTGTDEAVVMQKLAEDSNVWYGQWEGDYTTLDDKGYQMTLGYSATSGSGSTGVNWSYKSEECKAGSGESGVENLQFELSADGKTAALGTHHWEEAPGPVVVVEDITLSLTVAEAVPTYITLYAPGNYRNNWSCNADDAMTPNADRTVWTIHIAQQNLGTYEMKVIAEYADSATATGNSWGWGNAVLDNGEGGNFSLNILRANAHGTIDLNERANDGQPFAYDWSKLPDPALFIKLNFEVTFGAALADTLDTWYVIGNFNGWQAADAWKFTVAADKLSMTVSGFGPKEADIEFGVCVDSNWSTCLKMIKADESLGNFAVTTLAAECKIAITVSAAVVAELNAAAGEYGATVEVVPANA